MSADVSAFDEFQTEKGAHRKKMRDGNVPEQEVSFLREGSVENRCDLLCAVEVPVYQA